MAKKTKEMTEQEKLVKAYKAVVDARAERAKAQEALSKAMSKLSDAREAFESITDDVKYNDEDDSFYSDDDDFGL